MVKERAEEYLGAIYRLREDRTTPLPLSRLTEYFGFSPVSVHEMVKKLAQQDWVSYHPYQGVTLTQEGEQIAASLLRRHRLWERFLTDTLDISWESAHEIAGRLEHAAPELVTERLSKFLGKPSACPHGGPIPPHTKSPNDQCLTSFPAGARGRIIRISPESSALLHQLQQYGLFPGCQFHVLEQQDAKTTIEIGDQTVDIPTENAQAIWAEVF